VIYRPQRAVKFLLLKLYYIWGHLEKRNKDVLVEVNLAEGFGGLSGVAGD
jgi:hypothetical protein